MHPTANIWIPYLIILSSLIFARYTPSDDKTIWVKYRCLYSDPEIPIEITVEKESVTADVKCKPK